MKRLLQIGNSIFAVLSILWMYFSIYFVFQFLSVDYTNVSNRIAILLILALGFGFLSIHFKIYFKKYFKWIYLLITNHKVITFLVVIFFQLIVTLTSLRLASADTTIIYNLAVDSEFAKTSNYISINPNNFLLLIWYKLNLFLFGDSLLLSLSIWNIIFIDLSIVILYRILKIVGNQHWSDINFLMMCLIIGLSPQHIYTYSDPLALFLVTLLIYLIILCFKRDSRLLAVLSGFIMALGYGVRPPMMIFIIAGFIVVIYRLISKAFPLKKIKTFFLLIISFLVVIWGNNYILSEQKIVNYEPSYSRTLLYYINLGLTYSGNIHSEISQEVLDATGDNRNKTALSEIKMRLEKYNFGSFTGHLFYKFYWATNEGMFGWLQESVLREESPQTVPLLRKHQKSRFAKIIRSFIYREGANYQIYALFIQLIWLLIVLGLVIYSLKYFSYGNYFLLWMQITVFGGLLFLMIFEAGRTRYLIQFLPAITTISSYALSKIKLDCLQNKK